MIWVGIAMLTMYITGDGDDTRRFREAHEMMVELVPEIIGDPTRQAQAQTELGAALAFFVQRRKDLHALGECVEKADRSYHATTEDYRTCGAAARELFRKMEAAHVRFKVRFRRVFTDQEWQALQERLPKELD